MLKKRPLRRCYGLQGMDNQRDGDHAPSTTERQASRPGEDTVYSPTKYRETEGTKDIKDDSYTASEIRKIDTAQVEDHNNLQGATSAIRRLVSFGDYVSRPANPTRVYSSRIRNNGSSPITITLNPGESSSAAYSLVSTVYDCSTWANYYSAPTYDYVGYFASSHNSTEEKKTVLAQSGSTAMQNFAFDMEE